LRRTKIAHLNLKQSNILDKIEDKNILDIKTIFNSKYFLEVDKN
jgi:hypothetical protein